MGTTTSQGYVSVNLPVGVTGYGVFRLSVPGSWVHEAVVPLAYPNATTLTMVYDDTNFNTTSVAIVNPATAAASITVTIEDLNGNVIATSTSPLVLRPGRQPRGSAEAINSGTQRSCGQSGYC